MSEQAITSTEYGVLYPNGTIDWNTTSWFGAIETPAQRDAFREQYNLRMQTIGAVDAELLFLTRTATHTYTPHIVIDDKHQASSDTDSAADTLPEDAPQAP